MKKNILAALLLGLTLAPRGVFARQIYIPKYNATQLRADLAKWIDALDSNKVSADYSKATKDLLSTDETRQLGALELLGASKDPRVIPWLIPFMDNAKPEIHVYAAMAIEKVIAGYAYQDHSKFNARIAELRPTAGIVLKMFKMPDDGNTWAYASSIAAMLKLKEFEDEIQRATESRHPATSDAAKLALKNLGIQQKASNHSLDRPAAR